MNCYISLFIIIDFILETRLCCVLGLLLIKDNIDQFIIHCLLFKIHVLISIEVLRLKMDIRKLQIS